MGYRKKLLKATGLIVILLAGLLVLFPKQTLVIGLVVGGKIIAPEASAILAHYCFGDGSTLYLSPAYLRRSPVVLRSIKNLKDGEVYNTPQKLDR